MMRNLGHGISVALLAVLLACGPTPEEVGQIKSQQQDILGKLGDLDKKLDQLVTAQQQARPAAPQRPSRPDTTAVYSFPVGSSPTKGPADAWVTIVEVSDFQ